MSRTADLSLGLELHRVEIKKRSAKKRVKDRHAISYHSATKQARVRNFTLAIVLCMRHIAFGIWISASTSLNPSLNLVPKGCGGR